MKNITLAVVVVALGILAGYMTVSYISDLQQQPADNYTYESSSFASQKISKYNITLNTQLPQILKNPIWKTPIKVYVDEKEAQKRRLHERPIEGLKKAMATLENETGGLMSFVQVSSAGEADIIVNFTFNLTGENADEEVVGKAGPTLYVRAGAFTVIKKGEMFLLPVEYECTSYTLAMHEMGHVLGFGHSQVRNSVMWPRFGCLTNNITEVVHDIKEIYQYYKPDLAIKDAAAATALRGVNIDVDVANEGPKQAGDSQIFVYFNGRKVHSEALSSMEPGYSVNFRAFIPSLENIQEITVEVDYSGDELTKGNNAVDLTPQ